MANGYDPNVCRQKLSAQDLNPPCPDPHCLDIWEGGVYHSVCGSDAQYYWPVQTIGCFNSGTNAWQFFPPKQVAGECGKLIAQDPNWGFATCYCCCSCFANGTAIATPNGEVAIATLVAGDEVLAGSMHGGAVQFAPATVQFSQGTGSGGKQPAMVYIVYGPDNRAMVATPDQPFLLADGRFVTGSRLVPGQQLLGTDGTPRQVTTVSLGSYTGGVHHIATSNAWEGTTDGHLISAGGVVVGDFVLQLHFPEVPQSLKVDDHDTLPLIGSERYTRVHSHVFAANEGLTFGSTDAIGVVTHDQFRTYATQTNLPPGAVSFLTPDQAEEILDLGTQRPVSDHTGYALATAAINLLSGFHRDIVFDIEWNMVEPNVYAFHQYGQQFVVLSGGLIRTPGMFYEGLTMALAHGVARLMAEAPTGGSPAMSCTGQADFLAFGVISQRVWFGNAWAGQVMAAYKQLSGLLGQVKKNAAGNVNDVCGEPGIACRLEAISSGLAGGSLPACAGGPAAAAITLESVTATGSDVALLFSQAITPATAMDLSNYSITPAAKVTAARLDADKDFIVHLTVALQPGKYTISVTGLESPYEGVLDPSPATQQFSVLPPTPGTISSPSGTAARQG